MLYHAVVYIVTASHYVASDGLMTDESNKIWKGGIVG
jgi:hypothetical protein